MPVALKAVPTFKVALAEPTDKYAPPSTGAVLILMLVALIETAVPKTSVTVPAVIVVSPRCAASSATVMERVLAVAEKLLPTFSVAVATATVSVPLAVMVVLDPPKVTPKSVNVTDGSFNVRIEPSVFVPV